MYAESEENLTALIINEFKRYYINILHTFYLIIYLIYQVSH